ncbi:MAG: peptidoglycan editing factor PgeF [Candidatus Omnitrophica bacterium]|nr:peptidoglycan editing factor PgeF [Candidatus Omnitrophota bacterium]
MRNLVFSNNDYLIKDGCFYFFLRWKDFPLSAFFSSRELDFRQEKNYEYLCQKLGIERKDLILPEQRHSFHIEVIDFNWKKKKFVADALITQKPNIALAVLTADCFPVFLYEPIKKVIGIVHAGWRGTKAEILKKTIIKMQECFSINPGDLEIAFGPGIRECCYEVKDDLREYFFRHIQEREGKLFLNLKSANFEQLQSSGIKRENIIDSEFCSLCQNRDFFSFRKEGENSGRTVSVIMLRNK